MSEKMILSQEILADYCQRHHIQRLALFGSTIRNTDRVDSDLDLLVEFDKDHTPGLIALARMERELSTLLGGRVVDLRTPQEISQYFRQSVLEEAEVQYAT